MRYTQWWYFIEEFRCCRRHTPMCNRPIVPETATQMLLDIEGQPPEVTQFLMGARHALLKQGGSPASEKNRDDARKR